MGNMIFKVSGGFTPLDNDFIDEYMGKAKSADFSLVYIYGLRCAFGNISVSNEEIAAKLDILESDVIKAWKYWKKEGLVEISSDNDTVNFLPVKKQPDNNEIAEKTVEAPESKENKIRLKKTDPSYAPTDIEDMIKHKPETKQIISKAENILAKTLTPNEAALVVKMYDWLGMSEELVVLLLNYCVGKGKKNMAYIEKVAMDWNDKNITTPAQAQEYLDIILNDYNKIMQFCGVKDRTPTKSQQEYMYKWINNWHMPLPLIERACEKTIENTGKASFGYINKILEQWYDKNINTVEMAEEDDRKFAESRQNTTKKKPSSSGGNKFINYDQKTYSDSEWEEILERKAKENLI